jgi:MFS family permease
MSAMKSQRKELFPIYVSIGVFGLTLGLTLPLLALAMERVGASVSVIGLNTFSANFAALAASFVTPFVMLRIGGKRVIVGGLLLCGVTLALFATAEGIPVFFVYRICNGLALGFIFVATETFIIALSEPERRSRNMGIYGISISLGASFGPFFGFRMFEQFPHLPFVSGGLICLVPLVLVSILFSHDIAQKEKSKKLLNPGRIAIPLGAAVAFGFILEGIFALIALYLKDAGFAVGKMGIIITAYEIGAIVLQYPLCAVADRVGKTKFLAAAYLLAGVLFLAFPFAKILVCLSLLTFLAGGVISAIYPVGMAIAGDEVAAEEYPQVAAYMSVGFSVGAIVGPLVLSFIMEVFGPPSLVYSAGALVMLLALHPLYQISIKGKK